MLCVSLLKQCISSLFPWDILGQKWFLILKH